MRILPLIILPLYLVFTGKVPDSPHGENFKISCSTCHSSSGWFLDRSVYSFDHNTTKLPLTGQHVRTECRQCHPTLVFSDAGTECISCHKDIHQATTGQECSRCHSTSSWLVNNIEEIHRNSRFPLLGAHRTTDCSQCHKSETALQFNVAGITCVDCHRDLYISTKNPDHVQSGFSEDCAYCHPMNAIQWPGAGFSHSFFSLALGHSSAKCSDCHTSGGFFGLSSECYSCHQQDYETALSPDHPGSKFPLTCRDCHSLNPGWKPASFRDHDSKSFPINSGKHKGEWDACTDCHTSASDYRQFTCLNCHAHNQSAMDGEHRGNRNYSYESSACYHCHPRGDAD